MFIKKILLKDFRIYQGENELEFNHHPNKNVFIISGENGFGKTTFLTSLVWCLYGKLMIDVDDKFKREIYEAGGYKRFASANLNRASKSILIEDYSVAITFSDVLIPSIPAQEVTVKRTFSLNNSDDNVEILLDGEINELTKEVGSDIFIHDFILPKEVAKFFFFDAEKIVDLAEMKSIEDKRNLSKAYGEVLGIKKYEDLKNQLEDLRIRFKRHSASKKDKSRYQQLSKDVEDLNARIQFNKEQISNLKEEKVTLQKQSEQYQEKLIREGSSLSMEELIELKRKRDNLSQTGKDLRNKIKDLIELAPFAIAGQKLLAVRQQLLKEQAQSIKTLSPELVKEKIKNILGKLKKEELEALEISKSDTNRILKSVKSHILQEFLPDKELKHDVLLEFTETEQNEFEAIYDNLKYAYKDTFKGLVGAGKKNRTEMSKVISEITNAESKENDILIQEIRNSKNTIDARILEIELKTEELNQEIGGLQIENSTKSRMISELIKRIKLDETDSEKDKVATRLIQELNEFINQLKLEKKDSLETNIKFELNRLMHKKNFIDRVEVDIKGEIMDINLYDYQCRLINKDSLSKGEQQLYATSLLKALVNESNIKFPIFIDSPLQKFDKKHSRNIICEFYPEVSEQVVLLPLLEKELNENEYNQLKPKINTSFLINNINQDSSEFIMVKPSKLFTKYREHEQLQSH